jgi:hypothetical protein
MRQFAICALVSWLVAVSRPAPVAAQQGATTVQLPSFGVVVDAEGVLKVKLFVDPTGELRQERLRAAKAQLPANLLVRSPLRKVSLVRLEAAIRRRLDAGQGLDDAMRFLAGLQRLKFVFFYPETRDVVIAGAAEGFLADPSGRVCGMTTGRPVLELDDLLVVLRALLVSRQPPGSLGCSIDPTTEGLAGLREFQRTIPDRVPEAQRQEVGLKIADGMRSSLGMFPIRVFGVPADTHFAQVLIEADYRMKMIGIGLEQPPLRLASFFELIGSSPGRQGVLQRWWFTPDYDCVKVTDDRLAMELVGEGVQLQTEAMLAGGGGQLKSGAPSSRASELFVTGFTRKYAQLAGKSPVYAQLRNLIDMAVAAAFVRQQGYVERAGWTLATYGDEALLPVRTPAATRAAAAVNAAWRANRFVCVAGGGVSIRPAEALSPPRLMTDKDGKLGRVRSQAGQALPADRWWWD